MITLTDELIDTMKEEAIRDSQDEFALHGYSRRRYAISGELELRVTPLGAPGMYRFLWYLNGRPCSLRYARSMVKGTT